MPSPFEKQTVYHSELVANSPIHVKITCAAPQPSKYSKPGAEKPPQIAFSADGKNHFYVVENDACGAALTGYNGRMVTITATGSRDDAAIEVAGAAPQQAAQQPPAPAQQQPTSTDGAMKGARAVVAKLAVLYRTCLSAAEYNLEQFYKMTPGDDRDQSFFEDVRNIATTLFIEAKNRIDVSLLPTMFPGTTKPLPKPQAAPPPPRQEPPPPRQQQPPQPQGGYDPADDMAADDILF